MRTLARPAARGVLAVAAALLLSGGGGSLAAGEPAPEGPTRVLLGFERDEMARIAGLLKDPKDRLKEEAPGLCVVDLRRKGYGWKTWNVKAERLGFLRIRRGDASQGEWAHLFEMRTFPVLPGASFKYPEDDPFKGYGYPTYRPLLNSRGGWLGTGGPAKRRDLLNTQTWFKALPSSGWCSSDWSGYDRFRVDVKCPDSSATLRVSVEDEFVSPPVERRFKIPPGKWVTVEIDLGGAQRERGLDLSKMVHFWIFLEGADARTAILLDNLRLERAGVKAKLPLVADDRPFPTERAFYAIDPMQFDLPEGYKVAWQRKHRGFWKVVDFPPDEPAPAERTLAPPEPPRPVRVPLPKGETPFLRRRGENVGWVPFAFDARRIAVPFMDRKGYLKVVATEDGGRSWKGMGGEGAPTPLWRARGHMGFDLGHGELYFLSPLGCQGYDFPVDRMFFRKLGVTTKGWQLSPAVPVAWEQRHCSVCPTALRLDSGRIWAA